LWRKRREGEGLHLYDYSEESLMSCGKRSGDFACQASSDHGQKYAIVDTSGNGDKYSGGGGETWGKKNNERPVH
jgi:hypothetical protein